MKLIIVDYNLMNDYKKGDVEKLKFNFGQMDKALRKVYEYTYPNHQRLIFTSLYGVKEDAVVDEQKVTIDYANRVPFIVVDEEYTRNTAVVNNQSSIAYVSQTLLHILGNKTKKSIVFIDGKGEKGSKTIILVTAIIIITMTLLYFLI